MPTGTITAVSTDEIELVFVCDYCDISVEMSLTDFAVLGQVSCDKCGVSMDMSDTAKVVMV